VRYFAFLVFVFWIAVASATAAPKKLPVDPPSINIGEKRSMGKGQFKTASMTIGWSSYGKDLIRDPDFNEAASSIQQGPFPSDNANPQQHYLRLLVTVDATGSVVTCETETAAEMATVTTHACPHIRKNARFHPALNKDGVRVEAAGEIYVFYDIEIVGRGIEVPPPAFAVAPPTRVAQKPKPIESIRIEHFGLDKKSKKSIKSEGIGVRLSVESNGTISSCRLTSPTYIDKLDMVICKKALDIKFAPARDRQGMPLADSAYFWIDLKSSNVKLWDF
jgi:hypothetical protein